MSKNINVIPANTFDMRSLIGAIPQQHSNIKNSSKLTNVWTNEFLSKPKTVDLNTIWNQTFSQVQPPILSNQVSNVSSWITSYTQQSQNNKKEEIMQNIPKNNMWSSEYLEKFDETSDNLANEWLDEFMNNVPSQINSDEKMDSTSNNIFTNQTEDYENEWDELFDNNSYFSQLTQDETIYEFAQVSY